MEEGFLTEEEINTVEEVLKILDNDNGHFKSVFDDIETYKKNHQNYLVKRKEKEDENKHRL